MSRYDLFRRRLAPAAFALAVGVLAYQTCSTHERIHATVVLDLGAARDQVRGVDAEIWMNSDQVAQFRRVASEGSRIGATRFDASLPDHDGQVRIDVELVSGEHRAIERAIHVSEGATVSIALERDLR